MLKQDSLDEYLNSPALSSSALKLIADCPRRYKYHQWKEPTDAQRMGTLLHALILEPETMQERFFITNKVRRAGKAWEEIKEHAGEREVIFTDDYKKAEECAEVIMSDPQVDELLADGRAEQSLYWSDMDSGLQLKSRPDYLSDHAYIDLKTTVSAEPEQMRRNVLRYKYTMQLALGLEGAKCITGDDRKAYIIAIEKEPPYCYSVLPLSEQLISIGQEEVREAINTYLHCQSTGHWPAYGVCEI